MPGQQVGAISGKWQSARQQTNGAVKPTQAVDFLVGQAAHLLAQLLVVLSSLYFPRCRFIVLHFYPDFELYRLSLLLLLQLA